MHPDKGGDAEKFKVIARAYEVLGSADTRGRYDAGGEAAVDGPQQGGPRPKKPRTPDATHTLHITLDDYNAGKVVKVSMDRKRICEPCRGNGTKTGVAGGVCTTCGGRGAVIMARRMGMLIQQSQEVCGVCDGTGTRILPANRCDACKGARVVSRKELLEVVIDKGFDKEQVVLEGYSDEAPGRDPGDVVFTLATAPHPLFERVRNTADLRMNRRIKLRDALCGCTFAINWLGGVILLSSVGPGEVRALHKPVAPAKTPLYPPSVDFTRRNSLRSRPRASRCGQPL